MNLNLRVLARLSVLAAFSIPLTGCLGGGSSGSNIAPSSGFVLNKQVVELDKTPAKVTKVDPDSITFTGAATVTPGQILIHNATDATRFLRKVVSSTTTAGTTTVKTSDAYVGDVFDTANIKQQAAIGQTDMLKLQPALPGLTITPAASKGRATSNGITLGFHNIQLNDDSGNSICQIDGTMNVNAGIETRFSKSFLTITEFRAAPFVNASGSLTARGRAGGSFHKEFPLTLNLAIPVTPLGPLGVNCDVQLMMKVDGVYSAQGQFSVNASVFAQEGIQYTNTAGWSLVNTFDHTFNMVPPSARASLEMDVSLVRPKIGVDVLGIGQIFATADAVRVVGKLTAQTAPVPGFWVEALGDFNIEVGGSVKLGPLTLWSDSKNFALGRFNIVQPYLIATLKPTDSEIVFSDLAFKTLNAMNGDGSNDHVIFTSSTQVFAANVANAGGRIAFCQTDAKNLTELWVCNANGSSPQRIVAGTLSLGHPVWSPSGQEIAYEACDSKGIRQLFVINAGTRVVRQLTSDTRDSQVPAWTADGTMLYFQKTSLFNTTLIARTLSTSSTYDVVLADDTTNFTRPSLSPNGIQMVCIRGGKDIIITDERGTFPVVLVSDSGIARPTFSPDGLHIIATYTNATSTYVGSVDLNGQNPVVYGLGQQPSWGMSH